MSSFFFLAFYVHLGENVQLIFDQSLLSRREKLHEEDNSRETLLPTSKASATMYASVRGQQSQSSRGRQQMGLQRGVQSKIQQSRSIATDRSHSISSDVLGMQRFLSISYLYIFFFNTFFFLSFFFLPYKFQLFEKLLHFFYFQK